MHSRVYSWKFCKIPMWRWDDVKISRVHKTFRSTHNNELSADSDDVQSMIKNFLRELITQTIRSLVWGQWKASVARELDCTHIFGFQWQKKENNRSFLFVLPWVSFDFSADSRRFHFEVKVGNLTMNHRQGGEEKSTRRLAEASETAAGRSVVCWCFTEHNSACKKKEF